MKHKNLPLGNNRVTIEEDSTVKKDMKIKRLTLSETEKK